MLTGSEAALARSVLIHGPISRAALTERLGLSPASLTRLAKPFLDRGILIELDNASDGSVGRPSKPLDVSPDLGRVVGIKLTGDRLYAVLTDVRARVLADSEVTLADSTPADVVEAIARVVIAMDARSVLRVGVSLGGSVCAGVVSYAPFLGWSEVPLARLVSERLGVPVVLENDIVALAEAERWFGVGRGIAGFPVITIGAGVGYGLVIDGEVVQAPDAGVGLGGHIPLSATGPVCAEGHRGCSQAMLSSGSIAAQVSGALQRPVDYDEALGLAAAGDAAAGTITDAAADALGRFIALAANLTLQSDVVLGGEGIALFRLAEDRVRTAVAADRDPLAEEVSIHVDEAGFLGWARGAAAVAIQSAFGALTLTPPTEEGR